MIDLKINLEDKKSYTSFGNYFSKSLIIAKQDKKILLVVENEKYINLYEKILNFLGKNLIEIKNNFQLIDLLLNDNSQIFAINIDDFQKIKANLYELKKEAIYIEKSKDYDLNELINTLNKQGYKFSDYLNNGTYKKAGDLVYIKSFDGKKEYKISFWGDNIEEIWEKDILGNKNFKDKNLDFLYIGNNFELIKENNGNFDELLNTSSAFCIIDLLDFHEKYEKLCSVIYHFCSFDYITQRENGIELAISNVDIDNVDKLKEKMSTTKNVFIFTKNTKLIENFSNLNNLYYYSISKTKENFLKSFESNNILCICDDNISKIFIKKRIKKNLSKDLDLLLKIKSGDYIVHIDHGIGIFNGIVTKEVLNIKKEYIEIEYKNNDKLFVPINEIRRVNKYIGDENPQLTGLNTKEWERKMEKVNKDVEKIAKELLEIHAKRITNKGFEFERFKEKEKIFKNSFPYIYTESQILAIEEILNDMSSIKNMDRLLVGDVGFGKTEVAFNAIYNVFLNKKQSCLISPLVVLAYEHLEKAKERFESFGLKIGILTRLETKKYTNQVLKDLASGEINLIIGTHKLLSDDIKFKNLGLIILDEEHKFGVEHKEKLKKLKIKLDTLSMSATPIPRSLNLALSNIKDISIIKEAPIGRKNINTIVSKFNENVILEGYKNEISRGGQVFFIHNRIETINHIKKFLSKFIPEKEIIITHGRLSGDELEDRIIDFKNKKYKVLLSTTVIENGIDFPNVNTIFINNADNFGLSQIHQLRGRVGRSDKQGFCYILYKKENINKDTAKRLKTIVDYSYLGAGFEIAMKDLEIRGGGDILGIRQSGINKHVSVNIFLDLLEKKILELKNDKNNIKHIDTVIDLNIESYINDDYFNSDTDKINFYKEIEDIENLQDLDNLLQDFKNINGKISTQEQNLFDIIKLRILASNYKITKIKKVGINYQIDFDQNINVEDLKKFLELDKEVIFTVVDLHKIRSLVKNFTNDNFFLQYVLHLFEEKKINLISKNNLGKS